MPEILTENRVSTIIEVGCFLVYLNQDFLTLKIWFIKGDLTWRIWFNQRHHRLSHLDSTLLFRAKLCWSLIRVEKTLMT